MTYQDWIKLSTQQLSRSKIASARLDSILILESEIHYSRAHILAHPETELSDEQHTNLNKKLLRRKSYEPIAYILGKKEFYGREFIINKHVLVPRPESEDIITLLLDTQNTDVIIDVGTGSGVLAITAKLEHKNATVYATDNDQKCLEIAKINAKNLNANIEFVLTNIIDDINIEIISQSVILANLPYVPQNAPINNDAKFEPPEAIFSASSGLWHYMRLFDQLRPQNKPQAIICESLRPQQHELAQLALRHGYKLVKKQNLQQLFTPLN